MSRFALRRALGDMPSRQPTLSGPDRRALVATVALMNPAELSDTTRAALVARCSTDARCSHRPSPPTITWATPWPAPVSPAGARSCCVGHTPSSRTPHSGWSRDPSWYWPACANRFQLTSTRGARPRRRSTARGHCAFRPGRHRCRRRSSGVRVSPRPLRRPHAAGGRTTHGSSTAVGPHAGGAPRRPATLRRRCASRVTRTTGMALVRRANALGRADAEDYMYGSPSPMARSCPRQRQSGSHDAQRRPWRDGARGTRGAAAVSGQPAPRPQPSRSSRRRPTRT